MRVKVLLIGLVIAVVAGVFSACGSSGDTTENMNIEADNMVVAKESPTQSNPQLAAESVVSELKEKGTATKSEALSDSKFAELTGITKDDVLEIYAYHSEPKDGLANVFIVKPYPSLREGVRSKLMAYKETCMREYEDFDILNSYGISKEAVVVDQGEYLVMLMVDDVSIAQGQLDAHISQ